MSTRIRHAHVGGDYIPVLDRTHERRLAGTVLAAKTVTTTTLEAEDGSVKQNLGTVGERELAVAQVFALLLVLGGDVILSVVGRRLDHPLLRDSRGLRLLGQEANVRRERGPLGRVEVLGVDHVRGEVRGVDGLGGSDRREGLDVGLLVDRNEDGAEVAGVRLLDRAEVGAVAGGWDVTDLAEGGDGASSQF
jgi:hypothetical protein